ncbi:uncharacterized protein J3R85_020801 [Psidium guajava]|nr:uncharacterized protein J3R85_020801 [Psidium guajava]
MVNPPPAMEVQAGSESRGEGEVVRNELCGRGLEQGHLSPPKMAAKACLQKFNAFEEEYLKQISWTLSDKKLRDEIKISISQKLRSI